MLIEDGVLPTYFPSMLISAPEGVEVKLHRTWPVTLSCPGCAVAAGAAVGAIGAVGALVDSVAGGAGAGAAAGAFCPGATPSGCAMVRLPDGEGSATGCEFAAGPDCSGGASS